jgi:hypothetical protein
VPRIKRIITASCMVVVLGVAVLTGSYFVNPAFAASSLKTFATNFTLLNFATSTATVAVSYVKSNGAVWPADAANTSFTIPGNGGQKIIRQYTDGTLTAGQGSAVVSSDQPLGAVAQVLAVYPGGPAQSPTSGAYSGISTPSDTWGVPLVARRGVSGSGLANSQIIIQNAGSAAVNVTVDFPGTFTKSGITIQPGAAFNYDLDTEAGLPIGFFGAAVVKSVPAGGQLAVVSNFFTGPDGLQTFNTFPASNVGTAWVIPLYTSRLTNGLSTPVAVQNQSGGTMAINNITLSCIADPASPTPGNFSLQNTTTIANNGSYFFNPVIGVGPTNWFGACRVTSASGNIVSFVQMRYVGTGSANAAAYEAMNASGTDKKVLIPLIAKRLANGFATAATIVNLNAASAANVTLTYTAGAGSPGPATLSTSTVIPAGGSLIQNQRLSGFTVGVTAMPDTWFGTLTVTSSNQPIHGFVQLTYITATSGDLFMAHNAFTQP